ncbi:hypothetical protein [Leptothoe kymatousa]|uniref:Uncharacterized protein n=1 Tax=Leptothoe kymatousa TAU-MAC 1615 TaxID=2364775 RepID=A0ABS5XZJ6_9CYAN|nr:hypothetical protein [Leptothoe kymatousa]MBT9310995.1 hypothetical protein [Leptothoe kymatousa TAU-MAC 1615]
MKDTLDNTTLIQKFLQGEDSLLANRELHIEKAREETQLLTNQGILLAKARLKGSNPYVVVRLQSDYWQVVHQLALQANYLPFGMDKARFEGATFVQYDYHSVPAGYEIHCQEAAALWKTWWVNHRQLELMDMLLLCDKRWAPVNKMVCETGTIYMKTWQGERVFAVSDTIVWLDRNTQKRRRRIQVPKHHAPGKTSPSPYPYHSGEDISEKPAPVDESANPVVPDNLRRVVRAGKNKLLIQTALGPILIEGENLSCSIGRRTAKKS